MHRIEFVERHFNAGEMTCVIPSHSEMTEHMGMLNISNVYKPDMTGASGCVSDYPM